MRALYLGIAIGVCALAAKIGYASVTPDVRVLPPGAVRLDSGNYLGSIIVPAAGSQNNVNTAVPFSIPASASYIAVVIDNSSAGYNFHIGTGSSLAATTNDLNQVGPATIQFPVNRTNGGAAQVIAIYNGGLGGTARVYQSDGSIASAVVQ